MEDRRRCAGCAFFRFFILHFQFHHRGGGLAGEAATEDRQLPQRLLLGWRQQIPGIPKYCAQALLARRQIRGRVGQKIEILGDLPGDLGAGQQPRPAGG